MEALKRHLKPHQLVFSVLYPATLLVAFFYSTVGNPPDTYFSSKRNIFNVFFVKIGWFWVTLAYFLYLYLVPSRRLQNIQAFSSGLTRYALVTLYWYLMTQWLLGPSFIDRVYVLSGGKCASLLQDTEISAQFASVMQQQVCRKMGGQWTGGHDVSGHCVLLIHASLFFWEELSWMFYNARPFIQMKQQDKAQYGAVVGVLALTALWWFMLFMTGVYFHGHYELLSGAIFGILGWAVLYLGVFPRLPAIGLPSSTLL